MPASLESEFESREGALRWYRLEFMPRWRRDSARLFAGGFPDAVGRIKDYMAAYGPGFEFIGAGSERAAFGSARHGLCLKLCAPYDGRYQNQTHEDARIYGRFGGAECLCRLFDWDELGFSSSVCELCRPADGDAWIGAYGVPYGVTCEICRQMVLHRSASLPPAAVSAVKRATPSNPEFVDGLLAAEEPKYRSLASWIRIGIETGGQALRDAFGHIENWGLAPEGGEPVMKITDYGL